MEFNIKFTCKYKIKTIYETDNFYNVEILDTGNFDCEAKTSQLSGMMPNVYEGDVISSECMFVKNDKNGYILKSFGIPKRELPIEAVEMAKYASKQISGVSKDTMLKVIKDLGEDFIDKINKDKSCLENIDLPDKKKELIISWCDDHYQLFNLMGLAYLKGVSPREIIAIYKKYGSKSMYVIEDDPYAIFLYGISSFRSVDNLAKKQGFLNNCTQRIQAIAFNFILGKEESGSMAVKEKELFEYLESKKFTKNEYLIAVENLVKGKFIDKEVFSDTTYYGKIDNLKAERIIANYINEVKSEKSSFGELEIKDNLKGTELNKQQMEALFGCLKSRFSILTGGPGTGKTYTIERIIRTVKYARPDFKIALMAPTGKAAARMNEMIKKMDAKTIHASLKISENDDIMEKEGEKIEDDLVVIDEASMIDEKLFSYFCRHVKKETQVILVGDTGQLPSVGAGNLLDQLSKIVPVFELTQICRQDKASPIVLNAHRIRNKEFDQIDYGTGSPTEQFQFIETDNVVEKIAELYKGYTENEIVKPMEIMILSPQHNKNGTDQINEKIRELNKNEIVKVMDRAKYKKNDRIIQLKNTNDLGIHNGDLGTVVGGTEDGLLIDFDILEEPLEITDIKNIDFAYAITVHKSQGSEANIVMMVFNSGHTYTLSNKLIYTALTRAKTRFIGIGSKEAFEKGCKKEEILRISLIKEFVDRYNLLALESREC